MSPGELRAALDGLYAYDMGVRPPGRLRARQTYGTVGERFDPALAIRLRTLPRAGQSGQ